MLISLSVLLLVYSGGRFTHAAELQVVTEAMSGHHHSDQASHQEPHTCPNCQATLDEHQVHCGAKLLALSSVFDVLSPILGYSVPAHKARDLIAQIFTPDPPPPRLA
ncbi:hypothetical protein [uncultured Cohaesibacter sp.]|uniref:hypothetical protein n=1 Tax=uncultured Cohaesibacter sp. TaxID=1002546 RepID=UPI0029312CE3|nr:hypothetical protein [uncultured Cohaesibacter sp.]